MQAGDIKQLRANSIEHFAQKQCPSSATKLKTVQSQSTNENEDEDQNELWRKIESKNNHILVNQLHFCRFIYYMIRNSSFLPVQKAQQEKLNLILFKHVIKLTKQLSDCKSNCFKLQEWG